MKSAITLFILNVFIGYTFSQDTISFHEFHKPSKSLNGKYIALGLQSIGVTNGDTAISPVYSYHVGYFKNGMKDSIHDLYLIDPDSDRLGWRGIFRNDTILLSTEYFPNGNPKIIDRYFNGRLISEQYYYENGAKQLEISYTICVDKYDNYDALWISYYKNGIVRFVGKNRSKAKTNQGEKYDTWFYYTDCGELYRIESYIKKKGIEIQEFDTKCDYYEWYDRK
jgi:hypothetical protein